MIDKTSYVGSYFVNLIQIDEPAGVCEYCKTGSFLVTMIFRKSFFKNLIVSERVDIQVLMTICATSA